MSGGDRKNIPQIDDYKVKLVYDNNSDIDINNIMKQSFLLMVRSNYVKSDSQIFSNIEKK